MSEEEGEEVEKMPWVVLRGAGARWGGGWWRNLACSQGSSLSLHGQVLGTERAQSLKASSSVPPCPPRHLLSSPCQSPLGPGLSTLLAPRYSFFPIRRRLWAPFFLRPSLRAAVCPPSAGGAGGTRPWTGGQGRQAPRWQLLHIFMLPSQSTSTAFLGLPRHPV